MRRGIIWLVVIIVLGLSIWSIVKMSKLSPGNNTASVSDILLINNNDKTKGGREAAVVLIEYSDFQCPACAAYHSFISRLDQEFGDKIKFVYRHFPLRQIHRNAELAAIAAEAAGKQDKFWEMHDLIFESQKEWSGSLKADEIFIRMAGYLNLDMEKFNNDLRSEEIKEKVQNDYQGGIDLGVNATPTFFLNGKKIQNPGSYEEFRKVISEASGNGS